MFKSRLGIPSRLWVAVLALVGLVYAAVACGTATYIIQRYDGPPQPKERIAILRVVGGTQPTLVSLNDEQLGPPMTDKNTRLHIELLPETYSVTLNDPAQFGRIVTLRFRAEAGRVYRVLMAQALKRDAPGTTLRPRVYEVDRDSDEPLRDVTIDEPLLVPPSPPVETPQAPSPAPPSQPEPEPSPDAGAPSGAALSDAAAADAEAPSPETTQDAGASGPAPVPSDASAGAAPPTSP